MTKPYNISSLTKYKTIDLFCGIGGIRKGFELTNGFKNVLSAEIDKYALLVPPFPRWNAYTSQSYQSFSILSNPSTPS